MELPADKPRMMPGVLTPDDILDAVNAGVDIFDTTYTFGLFLHLWSSIFLDRNQSYCYFTWPHGLTVFSLAWPGIFNSALFMASLGHPCFYQFYYSILFDFTLHPANLYIPIPTPLLWGSFSYIEMLGTRQAFFVFPISLIHWTRDWIQSVIG